MYTPSAQQDKARETNFTYHAPLRGQPERYSRIREAAKDLAFLLDVSCPASRELSLAMTNLEQTVFWANASIARNEGPVSAETKEAVAKAVETAPTE